MEANNIKCLNAIVTEPMGYIRFLSLVGDCRFVITDSGSLQNESWRLRKPCVVARNSTERPGAIKKGTTVLAGENPEEIWEALNHNEFFHNGWPRPIELPTSWDGKAGQRIVNVLEERL
jgi:UDP-N-acetylglucosamine 2-epimerase (non-hydrolysing)